MYEANKPPDGYNKPKFNYITPFELDGLPGSVVFEINKSLEYTMPESPTHRHAMGRMRAHTRFFTGMTKLQRDPTERSIVHHTRSIQSVLERREDRSLTVEGRAANEQKARYALKLLSDEYLRYTYWQANSSEAAGMTKEEQDAERPRFGLQREGEQRKESAQATHVQGPGRSSALRRDLDYLYDKGRLALMNKLEQRIKSYKKKPVEKEVILGRAQETYDKLLESNQAFVDHCLAQIPQDCYAGYIAVLKCQGQRDRWEELHKDLDAKENEHPSAFRDRKKQ